LSELFRIIIRSFVIALCLVSLAVAQARGQGSDALLARLDCPDRVKDVAFSPDGKLLAAGYGWNAQGGARIWNLADRTTAATLKVGKGDGRNVELVTFSPDGKLFAAANWDGDVMVWAVGSWGEYKSVLTNRGSPKSLSFSPTGTKLAFASDEVALVYDLGSGKVNTLAARKTPRDSFVSLFFSPDGKSITLCRYNAIEVRDAESGELIRSWEPGGMSFFGRPTPDGQFVIAGGGAVYGKKLVEIWNAPEGRKVGEMSGFRSGLFALAISNSGKHFAVAGGNYGSGGDLSLWDLKEARELGFVSYGRMPFEGLAFSPDDKILAAGSNDGFVLLYAADRLRGPELKKQTTNLCGEVLVEGDRVFIRPLSKVPMGRGFEYAWQFEVLDDGALAAMAGAPVVLKDWTVASSAATDRVRVDEFQSLLRGARSANAVSNYAVFGDIQNPGWNEGFIVKVYGDGSFVATDNPGRCLASGSLGDTKSTGDFDSLKKRLLDAGLIDIPAEPLTRNLAHYRTRFIELTTGGAAQLRSDAESVDLSQPFKGPTRKAQDFSRIFEREERFINSLLKAGLRPPQN
jgi:hypothetical protein